MNSDTEGRMAAGGNVSLTNYGVGSGLSDGFSGSSMVVGGNLFYRNGQIKAGDVSVGGTADLNQSVGTKFRRDGKRQRFQPVRIL